MRWSEKYEGEDGVGVVWYFRDTVGVGESEGKLTLPEPSLYQLSRKRLGNTRHCLTSEKLYTMVATDPTLKRKRPPTFQHLPILRGTFSN